VRATVIGRGAATGAVVRGAGAALTGASAASAAGTTALRGAGIAGAGERGGSVSSGSGGGSLIFGGGANRFPNCVSTVSGLGLSEGFSQRKRARFKRSRIIPKREGTSSP
jgi:hypothetical protein